MSRSFNRATAYLILAAGLASFAAQAQQSHDHGHAGHPAMQLELEHGRTWQTDAPLREGMSRIRQGVMSASQNGKSPSAAQAGQLVGDIERAVADMVARCRLAPKADANLHILLGRLLSAATKLKANPNAADGLPQMREVLDLYPRYFAHPGWQAVAHAH